MEKFIINNNLIDNINQLDTGNLTYEDIRKHYGTGRSYNTSTAYKKSHRYRVGVATNVGDIEISVWTEIAKRLIIRNGETELYRKFCSWENEHCPYPRTKEDAANKNLDLFIDRVMDSPAWADFLAFNEKYRPELLEGVETVTVFTWCCRKSGVITKALFERQYNNTVHCMHCGRNSEYVLLKEQNDNNKKKEVLFDERKL